MKCFGVQETIIKSENGAKLVTCALGSGGHFGDTL